MGSFAEDPARGHFIHPVPGKMCYVRWASLFRGALEAQIAVPASTGRSQRVDLTKRQGLRWTSRRRMRQPSLRAFSRKEVPSCKPAFREGGTGDGGDDVSIWIGRAAFGAASLKPRRARAVPCARSILGQPAMRQAPGLFTTAPVQPHKKKLLTGWVAERWTSSVGVTRGVCRRPPGFHAREGLSR